MARGVAVRRVDSAIKKGRRSAHGYDEHNPLEINIKGAIGEYAVAYYTGEEWHAFLEYLGKNPPDVGKDIQVRSTGWNKRMPVHKSDCPKHRFVLVWVAGAQAPGARVRLVGWVYGYEAQQKDYWCDPTGKNRPAYFVPLSILRPMSTLACVRNPTATGVSLI